MIYCEMRSPVGILYVAEEDNKIIFVGDDKPQNGKKGDSTLLQKAKKQLEEYFESSRKIFDLPLNPQGTVFQKAVWKALAEVPYGKTSTYGELAEKVSTKGASRAVGSAMAKNPISVILPCHRILPAGGKLGNYSMGGPANKEWLLLMEKQNTL